MAAAKKKEEKPIRQKWIGTAELCEKLDCSKAVVGKHRKAGKMTARRNNDNKKTLSWPWPKAQTEFEEAQAEKKQQIAASLGRPKFDLNAAEYSDLSAWEKVVKANEMGAKNAPDISYMYFKAIEQQAKTRLNQLKVLEAEGKTYERDKVESWAFRVSRANRDSWLNWPQVVSIKMSEELGIPQKKLHDILRKYIIKQLERNSEMPRFFLDEEGSHEHEDN